jgi:hypothetical protein
MSDTSLRSDFDQSPTPPPPCLRTVVAALHAAGTSSSIEPSPCRACASDTPRARHGDAWHHH